MKIKSLASGSSGNSYVIEEGNDIILVEAGLSKKKLKESLWDNDITISNIDTCLLSHAHL